MLAKAQTLGLRADGISFHVGSQCGDYDNYLEAFEIVSGLVSDAGSAA